MRNPLVSSALYLTSGVGGPTLVTEQKAGQPLAKRGWMSLPRENRYLLFDGTLLHGVVPGNGTVAKDGGVRAPSSAAAADGGADGNTDSEVGREAPQRRRTTLMVAFWQVRLL